jgi:hypothetical protein
LPRCQTKFCLRRQIPWAFSRHENKTSFYNAWQRLDFLAVGRNSNRRKWGINRLLTGGTRKEEICRERGIHSVGRK